MRKREKNVGLGIGTTMPQLVGRDGGLDVEMAFVPREEKRHTERWQTCQDRTGREEQIESLKSTEKGEMKSGGEESKKTSWKKGRYLSWAQRMAGFGLLGLRGERRSVQWKPHGTGSELSWKCSACPRLECRVCV